MHHTASNSPTALSRYTPYIACEHSTRLVFHSAEYSPSAVLPKLGCRGPPNHTKSGTRVLTKYTFE